MHTFTFVGSIPFRLVGTVRLNLKMVARILVVEN